MPASGYFSPLPTCPFFPAIISEGKGDKGNGGDKKKGEGKGDEKRTTGGNGDGAGKGEDFQRPLPPPPTNIEEIEPWIIDLEGFWLFLRS